MQLIFKLEGRLGNHFYILAAMIYVIKKYKNIDVKLFINKYVKLNNLDHIYKNFNEYIIDELPDNCEDIYESFDDNNDSTFDLDQFINEHINYEVPIIFNFCFFQINKYFLEYKDDVKKIFLVETDNTLKYKNIISEDDVFISVRRGDYIEAHFHVLTAEYYIDMYNIYFSGKNIYISSDDIDWCKENLILEKFNNCNNITYLENLDFLELYTIGTYFKNYICANSTFSAAIELSSDNDQKSIGIKNIAANICRNNMFSKNCTICDITNESNYNKYIEKMKIKFDKIYCLTIDNNEKRRKNISKVLNKYYHIDFEFFYAFPFYKSVYSNLFNDNKNVIPFGNYDKDGHVYIDYDDGRSLSIYIANYMIVYNALKKGLNSILIIEDDACLYRDVKLVNKYFNEIPDDADIVRYGYNVGDNDNTEQIKLNNKDKLFFKDNNNGEKMGAQMFALMNRKTMEIYCENIAKTLTGGNNPYNTFIHNEHNLNIYFALHNIALDHITYHSLNNDETPPLGYIPFDIKYIKGDLFRYFENE